MKTVITSNVTKAVEILRNGGLVAFPTETVYGLGADATNVSAVRKIFHAKERPYDHPLIVHIAGIEQLGDWAQDVSSEAMKLAQVFWPGPLTMILKKQLHVLDIVTGWQDTIGLRVPRHPVARSLLHEFGSGIAAPSANKFTHISPTTAISVYEELDDEVDLILDGGDCAIGLESTIIDMTSTVPTILRPGVITPAEIEDVLGITIRSSRQDKPLVRAPGMHHLHYAPKTKVVLVETKNIANSVKKLATQELPAVVVTWSDVVLDADVSQVKMPNDAAAYAKRIYQTLRSLDAQNYQVMLVEHVPDGLAWDAIRDRLSKASQ